MIMVTTDTVEGGRTVAVFGLVKGSSIQAETLGRDVQTGIRNPVGGEILQHGRLLSEAREHAISRMTRAAEQLGANAVVGVRFASSGIAGGASEVLAYGTAVKIE